MTHEVTILVADDDEGHCLLISRNLKHAGLTNEIKFFEDGQAILDFLFRKGAGPHRELNRPYLLLLDIRMPKVDGVDVLKAVKEDPELRKVPVIMVTTTDDPREVERCHALGCNSYVTKPVIYERFVDAIRQLGLFLTVVQVPALIDARESAGGAAE